MDNRNRIQKLSEFFVGFLSLSFAHIISYVFFTAVIKRIEDYSCQSWIDYGIIVILSYITVFFCFYSPVNLLKRSKPMEISSTLRNCMITYALLSVLLLISKNEIIDSRYLFTSSFIVYIVLSLAGRFVYKRIMIKKISNSKMATITGVITTVDKGN